MIQRKKTKQIKVGNVKIGGGAPILIQSMTKVLTSNVRSVVSQIKDLERCGCEIIRVAVKTMEDAEAIKAIKRKIRIPLVADIHFDYRLALSSIMNGADKIRLNPGNIRNRDEIVQVVKAARVARIPIRIGVNSGSVSDRYGSSPDTLVRAALGYIKMFERLGFYDMVLSLKASDVTSTVEAYRKMSRLSAYPLHLGVTAAGSKEQGVIKSSIGIGALLLDGIGDTLRVSLTADPSEEIVAAKRILSSLGIRKFGPDIISCPTCGRCQVDLVRIAREVEAKLFAKHYPLNAKRMPTIAIMGCEVNGPGEARSADIGIAAGKGSGILFVNGKIIRRVKEKDFVKELMKEVLK